jgi:hypothetical protein
MGSKAFPYQEKQEKTTLSKWRVAGFAYQSMALITVYWTLATSIFLWKLVYVLIPTLSGVDLVWCIDHNESKHQITATNKLPRIFGRMLHACFRTLHRIMDNLEILEVLVFVRLPRYSS